GTRPSSPGSRASEAASDSVVERQGTLRHNLAWATRRRSLTWRAAGGPRSEAAMPCRDTALATPFQDGMDGDQPILLEDADLASGAVHLDGPAACCVGHAIEIAVDRDHAVAGNAPLHPQHRLERAGRQSLEAWMLFGEMLGDGTPRGGMDAHIGHGIEPVQELCIEVREIA